MTAAKRKSAQSQTPKSSPRHNIVAIRELIGNLEELNRWQCGLLQTLRTEAGQSQGTTKS